MLSPSRLINKSTCRIVCDEGKSIGTGFFFAFVNPQNPDIQCPLLVTNKHVVQGCTKAAIRFNVKEDTNPDVKFFDIVVEPVSSLFLMHPDPDVDLCILPLAMVLNDINGKGLKIDAFFFSDENMKGIEKLTPVEDVFMTGYPNGLWDESNNRPITRKGITASDVNLNWNGKPEFMIDMACFGGSSGSPVFIMNEGSFVVNEGIAMGTRFILLGVLYAGPLVNVSGKIDVVNVPTAAVAVANSQIMMNLGFVIKAEKLNDFKKILNLWN